MLVDSTKNHIFIWVPGTGGHEVHPEFEKAIKTIVKADHQIIVVDYPASWNFAESVPVGVENLRQTLEQVAKEVKAHQRIYLAGSSQGAWVISDTIHDNIAYNQLCHKAVLFGHPGTAEHHDHHFDADDTLWEIRDPKDAVTFGWNGHEQRVIDAIRDLHHLRLRALKTVGWAIFNHPKTFWHLFFLVLYRLPIFGRNESPHDYSRQFPLAVYWLTN